MGSYASDLLSLAFRQMMADELFQPHDYDIGDWEVGEAERWLGKIASGNCWLTYHQRADGIFVPALGGW
jgi:hypothetical protein